MIKNLSEKNRDRSLLIQKNRYINQSYGSITKKERERDNSDILGAIYRKERYTEKPIIQDKPTTNFFLYKRKTIQ